MWKTIWLLEDSSCVYTAFESLNEAKAHAYALLIKWGYDPNNDVDEVFKELNETYADECYAGFYVDELVWCYAIDFQTKGD